MTEESHTAATQRINAQLAERWPDLFNATKPVPLAIGIYDALLEARPDLTARLLRRVLSNWCNRPRYLAALTAGAERHGLAGVQGEVTAQQAAAAAELLKAALARFKAKADAQKEAKKAAAIQKKAKQAKAEEAKAKAEAAQTQKTGPTKSLPVPAKPATPSIIVKKRRSVPSGGAA